MPETRIQAFPDCRQSVGSGCNRHVTEREHTAENCACGYTAKRARGLRPVDPVPERSVFGALCNTDYRSNAFQTTSAPPRSSTAFPSPVTSSLYVLPSTPPSPFAADGSCCCCDDAESFLFLFFLPFFFFFFCCPSDQRTLFRSRSSFFEMVAPKKIRPKKEARRCV